VHHKHQRHKHQRHKHKKTVHRTRTIVSRPLPEPLANPARLALGGAPVTTSSGGGSSPALLIIGFGVLVGLLSMGIAYAPKTALPHEVSFRLEPHRQTILVTGFAIGVACALVGLLTALAGS
jgi:hypothetical protein